MVPLWLLFVLINVAYNQAKTIETPSGKISGVTTNVDGKPLGIYLGIPYAKPPTGSRRFKRPEPISPWNDIYNATELPNTCPQAVDNLFGDFKGTQMWNPNTEISEDCLYLNVWVPMYGRGPKTVMVWIYGGSFSTGTSTLSLYDGKHMSAGNDVIVVSMQYRVSTFGFLYLGDEGAPGNMGLVDQQVALKWIHENIAAFGGDNQKVTIFGESAGAISVGMHLLSPMSWDYFQYGILQSCSPLIQEFYNEPEMARETSLEIAKNLGCDFDGDIDQIVDCLHGVSMDDIINNQYLNKMTMDNFFITKPIMELIEKKEFKKTSLLLGANQDEGSYFLIYDVPRAFDLKNNDDLTKEEYDKEVKSLALGNSLAEKALHMEYDVGCDANEEEASYKDRINDMLGDSWFICPTLEFAEAFADEEDVYFYQYTHRSSANPWPAWAGVMHGYEIDMVFGQPLNSTLGYTRQEKVLSRKMMKYWTDFAKTGNPNQQWRPYGQDKEYLVIDTRTTSMEKNLRRHQCHLWNDLIRDGIWEHAAEDDESHAHTMAAAPSLILLSTIAVWFYQ